MLWPFLLKLNRFVNSFKCWCPNSLLMTIFGSIILKKTTIYIDKLLFNLIYYIKKLSVSNTQRVIYKPKDGLRTNKPYRKNDLRVKFPLTFLMWFL